LQEGVSFEFTSPVDYNYNCLSWALGCNTKIFEKSKGATWEWPDIADDTADGWARLCEVHGYSRTDNVDFTPGVEKIAIFERRDGDDIWLHAARQDKSGKWKSKLGDMGPDIDHVGLSRLEHAYGEVVVILRRERSDWKVI